MSPRSVLVISGLGHWVDGMKHTDKYYTHVYPIVEAADRVTLLTIGPTPDRPAGLDVRRVRPTGVRFLDFLRLALISMWMAKRDSYDLVVSFSLVPYGLFALGAKYVAGTPAHLGIIGMDLDVHATGPFGPVIRRAFRRFDAISVAGRIYRDRLTQMGVEEQRIHTIAHPVRIGDGGSDREIDLGYDLLWIGRMSPEKDPRRFVRIVAGLHERGIDTRAAMVGDGPCYDSVLELARHRDVDHAIDLVGWQSRPIEWYQRARLTVVTSEREMLPLTVVESMLSGTPVVSPRIGGIPDIVEHGRTGYLVADRSPETFVTTIASALAHPYECRRMGERAMSIEEDVSVDAVADKWGTLLEAVT